MFTPCSFNAACRSTLQRTCRLSFPAPFLAVCDPACRCLQWFIASTATSDTNFCAAKATNLIIRSSFVATPLLHTHKGKEKGKRKGERRRAALHGCQLHVFCRKTLVCQVCTRTLRQTIFHGRSRKQRKILSNIGRSSR